MKEYKTHHLKTWPVYFSAVVSKRKKVEIRKNDRGFLVGDFLALEEFDPDNNFYTGDSIMVRVTHILREEPFVPKGYVCMSIKHTKVR